MDKADESKINDRELFDSMDLSIDDFHWGDDVCDFFGFDIVNGEVVAEFMEQTFNGNVHTQRKLLEITKALKALRLKQEEVNQARREEREKTELLEAIAFYALVVMTEIEQDGASIIPHLSDDDDNPGQALRTLLIKHGGKLKDTAYDFLSKGKRIQDGGYKEIDELIGISKYRRLAP